jgi:hypothetical protein
MRALGFLALFLLAACSSYTVVVDLAPEQDPTLAQAWTFAIPRVVTETRVTLDGRVPQEGYRLSYGAPSLPFPPRRLEVRLDGLLGRNTRCLRELSGTVNVQLFLGPPDTLWDHPVGDRLGFDLARSELALTVTTQLDEAQEEALFAGELAVGATVAGEVRLAPDTSDACADPDNPDQVNTELDVRLRLDRMVVRTELY